MASKKEKILKIAIIVLSVLLAISLSALAWMYYHYGRLAPAVVHDNVITTGSVENNSVDLNAIPEARIVERDVEVLTTTFGPETLIDEDRILELYRGKIQDQDPFMVENMFPGDVFIQEYRVQVSHRGPVQVNFKMDVTPKYGITDGEEKDKYVLADVIRCNIWINNGDGYELKYNGGLMRDMTEVLSCWTSNSSRATTSSIDYKIEVFLDTSVNNNYQDKTMTGEFVWWVTVEEREDSSDDDYWDPTDRPTSGTETSAPSTPTEPGAGEPVEPDEPIEPGELVKPPKTGDDTVLIFGAALVVGLFLIILLIGRRRKEDGDEA